MASFEEWLGSNNALAAASPPQAASSHLQQVVSDEPSGTFSGQAEASIWQAVSAVASNTLARFPTKSKVVNIYFFGLTALIVAVALLCVLFSFADKEDRLREEHEKDS